MALHREHRGERSHDRPHFVLAHGFTQNIGCWGRFANRLAEVGSMTLVDGPGHGRSHDDTADLWTAAATTSLWILTHITWPSIPNTSYLLLALGALALLSPLLLLDRAGIVRPPV